MKSGIVELVSVPKFGAADKEAENVEEEKDAVVSSKRLQVRLDIAL